MFCPGRGCKSVPVASAPALGICCSGSEDTSANTLLLVVVVLATRLAPDPLLRLTPGVVEAVAKVLGNSTSDAEAELVAAEPGRVCKRALVSCAPAALLAMAVMPGSRALLLAETLLDARGVSTDSGAEVADASTVAPSPAAAPAPMVLNPPIEAPAVVAASEAAVSVAAIDEAVSEDVTTGVSSAEVVDVSAPAPAPIASCPAMVLEPPAAVCVGRGRSSVAAALDWVMAVLGPGKGTNPAAEVCSAPAEGLRSWMPVFDAGSAAD